MNTPKVEYKYTDFNAWFKVAAPNLWSVKQWDNETIKGWLEEAFLSSRDVK